MLIETLAKCLTIDIRHDVPETVAGLARVVNGENIGMRKFCGELDLAKKPFATECQRNFGMHDLQRDIAVVLQVMSEIYSCHSAARDLAVDSISIAQCLLKVVRDSGCHASTP